MKSTPSGDNLDTSELDALESEYNSQIATLQIQIEALQLQNQQLIKQIASASVEEAATLRQQYNANKAEIDDLTAQVNALKQKLADLQDAKEEAAAGEDVQTDDYYRIPAIMQDCKTAFDLT